MIWPVIFNNSEIGMDSLSGSATRLPGSGQSEIAATLREIANYCLYSELQTKKAGRVRAPHQGKTGGDSHANALAGLAVRGTHAEEESRIRGRRGAHTGCGHWRKRRGFQRHERADPAAFERATSG